jgi:acyl carrier protein
MGHANEPAQLGSGNLDTCRRLRTYPIGAKLDLMGLDAVEIVLRTQEFFGIAIEDQEAAAVRTVGDLYRLICSKLELQALASPQTSKTLPKVTEKEKAFLFLAKHSPLTPPIEVLPWSSQSVWDCLVSILIDQQGLKAQQISYTARFVEDLGVD